MRIVHLYKDYFPPTVGGIEQTVGRMAEGAVRSGAHVTVLTSNPDSRGTVRETVQGVHVIRCAQYARALSTPICPSMPYELSRLRPDLCHLHYPSPPGEVSFLLSRPKAAMVLTWHCDVVRQKAALPIYAHFVRETLRKADMIMPTYRGQAEASSFLKPHLERCRPIPLGVDLTAFARTPHVERAVAEIRSQFGTPIIVFIGRLVTYKGVDVLLRAMPKIRGRLVVVGSGPDEARLKALCSELGLDDRVTFTGRIDADRLASFASAADVGVLPSTTPAEAFGLSMVEMMACGVPMVCTEVGTGTSFVNQHGVTGLVVPPNDPEVLADAVNRLLADEALRRAMGSRGQERAHSQFSTEAMMRKLLAAYEEVLSGRAQRKEGS